MSQDDRTGPFPTPLLKKKEKFCRPANGVAGNQVSKAGLDNAEAEDRVTPGLAEIDGGRRKIRVRTPWNKAPRGPFSGVDIPFGVRGR